MNRCLVTDSRQCDHDFAAAKGGTIEISGEGELLKVIGIDKDSNPTVFAVFFRPISANVFFDQKFADAWRECA